MSRGLSLHIGVRRTDPASYGKTEYALLHGPANDACAMRLIAMERGFRVLDLLVDERATFAAVEGNIRRAIDALESGDAFLMSYSGHGAHLYTPLPDDHEYDEGMVLYDYIMKDDWIAVFLRRFKPGVRVMMVFDSCYSYDMHQFFGPNGPRHTYPPVGNYGSSAQGETPRMKLLEPHIAELHRQLNVEFYRELDARCECEREEVPDEIVADIMVLSACGENETTIDGFEYGDFTNALLKALNGDPSRHRGPFRGSYSDLPDAIHPYMQGPMPRVLPLGPHAGDTTYDFYRSLPFTF